MGLYDNPESVDNYEKMCEGYDVTPIVDVLSRHLADGRSLLEIGSGPCNDIALLKNRYRVVGSDNSDEFLIRGRLKHPDVEFQWLDAVALEIEEKFDCIYSNKVLHHLKLNELDSSLRRQKKLLTSGGLIAHSFWIGDQEFEQDGQYFLYHNRKQLLELIEKHFTVVDTFEYEEFEKGDSVFIVAANG